jgi:predicted permease
MQGLISDLKHTCRSLRRRPGSTVAVVLVLALGIGLGSAIFALADPFLLRPLPYRQPDQLVLIRLTADLGASPDAAIDLRTWQEWHGLFDEVAAYRPGAIARLRSADGAIVVQTIEATANLFDVLGIESGQGARPESLRAGAERSLLLTSEAARRLLDGVLPQQALLDQVGHPARVAGILPESFLFPRPEISPRLDAVEVVEARTLVEIEHGPDGNVVVTRAFTVVARLAAGATAQAAAAAIGVNLARSGIRATVQPLTSIMRRRVQPLAIGSLAAGALVLIVCAANLANILLARSAFRVREFVTRIAIGARRLDLLRLMVIELVLILGLATAIGLACAAGVLRLAQRVIPAEFAALGMPDLTGRVVGVGLAAAVFLGFTGLLPNWLVWRRLSPAAPVGQAGPSESRLAVAVRRGMVAGQCAVAMVLLVGAVLLVRSQLNLQGQDTGFAPNVLAVAVSYPHERTGAPLLEDIESTIQRLRRLRGVRAAGSSTGTLVDDMMAKTIVRVGGKPELVARRRITAAFLEAAGMRLTAGRTLTAAEIGGGAVLVNEAFVRRHWADGSALGRQLVVGEQTAHIVGVVRDAFDVALDTPPQPTVFGLLDARTAVPFRVTYAVGLTGPERPSDSTLKHEVASVNRDAVVVEVRSLHDRLSSSVKDRSFATLVLAFFAVAGVGICAAGIAGVVAFVVARRTREIAIRIAIGAAPSRVRQLVLGEAMAAAAAGGLAGLAGGALLSRLVSSLLYGVSPGDWASMVGAALIMMAIVGVAAAIPASRAVRQDPTDALRVE